MPPSPAYRAGGASGPRGAQVTQPPEYSLTWRFHRRDRRERREKCRERRLKAIEPRRQGTKCSFSAHGRIAGQSIMKYLRGESLAREYKVTPPCERVEPVVLTDEEIEELAELKRPEMPRLAVEKRANNFEKVELGLSEEIAIKESRRCLRCDLVE